MSVGRDVLHRALEFGVRRSSDIAPPLPDTAGIRRVAGEFLPVARPIAAEPAIAVIDQQRPRSGGGRFDGLGGLISGCVWHDIDRDWRRVGPRRLLSRQMSIGALSRCRASRAGPQRRRDDVPRGPAPSTASPLTSRVSSASRPAPSSSKAQLPRPVLGCGSSSTAATSSAPSIIRLGNFTDIPVT